MGLACHIFVFAWCILIHVSEGEDPGRGAKLPRQASGRRCDTRSGAGPSPAVGISLGLNPAPLNSVRGETVYGVGGGWGVDAGEFGNSSAGADKTVTRPHLT